MQQFFLLIFFLFETAVYGSRMQFKNAYCELYFGDLPAVADVPNLKEAIMPQLRSGCVSPRMAASTVDPPQLSRWDNFIRREVKCGRNISLWYVTMNTGIFNTNFEQDEAKICQKLTKRRQYMIDLITALNRVDEFEPIPVLTEDELIAMGASDQIKSSKFTVWKSSYSGPDSDASQAEIVPSQ